MNPLVYNLIIASLIVTILYIFTKTKTFYLIRKRIYMFVLVRIPCQYFLMEQLLPDQRRIKFLMLLFNVPFVNILKHIEIEYDLFKKWYPKVLEEVERRMFNVPKEDIDDNEKSFTEVEDIDE